MIERVEKTVLPVEEAHVLLCQPRWVKDSNLLERYLVLLDSDERKRASRFRFEQDMRTFIVSRALLRTALSQYTDIPPETWRFRNNPFGRPEIDGPAEAPPLRFNLSHTRELVACVLSRTFEVGIDVEGSGALAEVLPLAAHYFSPTETEALRALPHEMQVRQFLSTWTLKEAYVKACGIGLSLPLDRFSFQIDGQRINVNFAPELADYSDNWSFTLMQPTTPHFLAVAVRVGKAAPPNIISRWFLPLASIRKEEPCTVLAKT